MRLIGGCVNKSFTAVDKLHRGRRHMYYHWPLHFLDREGGRGGRRNGTKERGARGKGGRKCLVITMS